MHGQAMLIQLREGVAEFRHRAAGMSLRTVPAGAAEDRLDGADAPLRQHDRVKTPAADIG